MNSASRKFPVWAYWVFGLAVIIGTSAGALWITQRGRPSIPVELVERRKIVAEILAEAGRVPDVDIRPLLDMEQKKNYKGAVALMDQALSVNAAHIDFSEKLISESNELAKLSNRVRPDGVGTKAIEAFALLARFASAEKKFYADQKQLYEMTRAYYADLETRKKPAIPEMLQGLVDQVNKSFKEMQDANRNFAGAVSAFDQAVAGL